MASCSVSAFSLKLIPKKMPNLGSRAMKGRLKTHPEMATTSSAAHAEMTRVGTPLATPYPLSERLIRQGMMTAGETAARTNPNMKPTVQGNPKRKCESAATAAASTKQGMKVARRTIPESRQSWTGSSSRPALRRMTARQRVRKPLERIGSNSCPMKRGWQSPRTLVVGCTSRSSGLFRS